MTAVKQLPTTSKIADLIKALDHELQQRYGNNYSTTISVGDGLVSATNPILRIQPVVEREVEMVVMVSLSRPLHNEWVEVRSAPANSPIWVNDDRRWIDAVMEEDEKAIAQGDLIKFICKDRLYRIQAVPQSAIKDEAAN